MFDTADSPRDSAGETPEYEFNHKAFKNKDKKALITECERLSLVAKRNHVN